MSDYKFDTFYYSEDKSSEHYLSEIENLSEEVFNHSYKGKIYCPLCKGPQLSLVRKEGRTFLRTYPNQPHVFIDGEICLYECDTASKKLTEEYIQQLKEKNKIKSVLESVMRRLLIPNASKNTISNETVGKSKDPLIIEKVQSDKSIKRNLIPHYSFRTWGSNIPQEQLLIVYGKVYIELKETLSTDKKGNTEQLIFLHFKDVRTKRFITSCKKPNSLDVSEGYYYAVVLGRCKPNEKENNLIYYNLWLNFPYDQSILLKPFFP